MGDPRASAAVNPGELLRPGKVFLTPHHRLSGLNGKSAVPAYTTVNRLRPLSRRAFKTARPARVAILFRNPCSRFRGIFFGW